MGDYLTTRGRPVAVRRAALSSVRFVSREQLASKSLSIEGELAVLTFPRDANGNNLTGLQFSEQDALGQRVLDLALDRTTQRT